MALRNFRYVPLRAKLVGKKEYIFFKPREVLEGFGVKDIENKSLVGFTLEEIPDTLPGVVEVISSEATSTPPDNIQAKKVSRRVNKGSFSKIS